MNCVYEIDTSRLVSSTTLEVDRADLQSRGMDYISSNKIGIWNPATLDFDQRPVKRVIDRQVFIDRFTEAEFEKISKASQTNDKIEAFLKKLIMRETVDLDAAWLQDYMSRMETVLLINPGRAVEILA